MEEKMKKKKNQVWKKNGYKLVEELYALLVFLLKIEVCIMYMQYAHHHYNNKQQ